MSARASSTDPAPAPRLACEILDRVERGGAYASVLLDRRTGALDDPRDAALVHTLVIGVLRRRAVLDAALARVVARPWEQVDPALRSPLRLGAYALLFLDRVPDFAAVDQAVRLARAGGQLRAAGFVNAVLRNVARQGRDLLPPQATEGDVGALALEHSHPRWWVERAVERLGWPAARRLLEGNNRPAFPVLSFDPRRDEAASLTARLAADSIEIRPGRHLPEALHVVAGRLSRSRDVASGRVWVQDEAAQLAGRLGGALGGPRALDLCAAPGGKARQLAARLAPGGLVVAVDRHRDRISRLAREAARAGEASIAALCADGRRPPFAAERFDEVLVDAPCSGTGTLRRHPEIRWRLTPGDLTLLAARQSDLLRAAAALVAPRGRLVYAVCSLEPEEGPGVVERFLREAHAFRIADASADLPLSARPLFDAAGALRTSPADGDLDGFYAVRLERRARS